MPDKLRYRSDLSRFPGRQKFAVSGFSLACLPATLTSCHRFMTQKGRPVTSERAWPECVFSESLRA